MMCYRDMSFCSDAPTCPKREGCPRHFSPEESAKANKWWGEEGAPVSFMSFIKTCKRIEYGN